MIQWIVMNKCVAIDSICIFSGIGSEPNTQSRAITAPPEEDKARFDIEPFRAEAPGTGDLPGSDLIAKGAIAYF